MWDAVYVYVIYLYVVKQIISAVISAIFPEWDTFTVGLWDDVVLIGYLHLHYLLILWNRNEGDALKAIIMINLATIFVVDVMSVIETISNKSHLQYDSIKSYTFWMVGLNTTWICAWYLLARPEGEDYLLHNDQGGLVVQPDGKVVDNRAVDQDSVAKINTLFYQPYYNLKNKSWSICLIDYELDEVISVLPVCHHTFHKECIGEWLIRNSTCPFCRRLVTRGDVQNDKEENLENILMLVKKSTIGPNAAAQFV